MKIVNFQYQTELSFSSPASEHRFILRILPQSDSRQKIKDFVWRVAPEGVVWRTVDGFGNELISGFIDVPHNYFRFEIQGAAEVSGEPYTESAGGSLGLPINVLLFPTELTYAHKRLVDFYNDIEHSAPRDVLERVSFFSGAVHTHLRYERGVTANSTTAQEAFDGGIGVCQDYAHILLALLRLDKIPCRYVAGLASDYGETHAWVEARIADKYCGIDPTRDKLIDEGYIAISRGRDFADCSIERGIFKGACRGTQTINLSMDISQ